MVYASDIRRLAVSPNHPEQAYTAYALTVSTLFCLVTSLSWMPHELGAFRNWQTLLNPLLGLELVWAGGVKTGTVTVRLSPGVKRLFVVSVLVFCVSVQWGRFFSFEVNGVDFSIFDWMLFNSNHGRSGYSPIYEVNHFGVHATYVLFPLMPLHRLFETPLFLCTVTALAVGGAAWPLWRLGRRGLPHEGLCVLLVLAYLTNPFTSALLDGGFRPEVFYPLFRLRTQPSLPGPSPWECCSSGTSAGSPRSACWWPRSRCSSST